LQERLQMNIDKTSFRKATALLMSERK
jgi:hypothetical protein